MPRKCCVIGCRSNYRSQPGYVTIFSLPREDNCPQLRAAWISAIGRPDYAFSKHSGVCALHFPERDIIRNESFIDSNGLLQIVPRTLPWLTKDAVPSQALSLPDSDPPTATTTTTEGTDLNKRSRFRKPKPLKETNGPVNDQPTATTTEATQPLKGKRGRKPKLLKETKAPGSDQTATTNTITEESTEVRKGAKRRKLKQPLKKTRAPSPNTEPSKGAKRRKLKPPLKNAPASPPTTEPSEGVKRRKPLNETLAPSPKTPNACREPEVLHLNRIILGDRLHGFNELQNSYQFRFETLLKEEKWSVMLERDSYVLFYKLSVDTETLIPRLPSVCVKNDMTVKVSAGSDRVIGDLERLNRMFGIRASLRVERWSELEKMLKTAETHLEALVESKDGEKAAVMAPVENPTELVKEASERLKRAAQLVENDPNRCSSQQLEFLSEQAALAIAKWPARRYGERLRRIACLLYARSPKTYRLLRDLNVLCLPFENKLRQAAKVVHSTDDNSQTALPILSALLQKVNTDSASEHDDSFSESE